MTRALLARYKLHERKEVSGGFHLSSLTSIQLRRLNRHCPTSSIHVQRPSNGFTNHQRSQSLLSRTTWLRLSSTNLDKMVQLTIERCNLHILHLYLPYIHSLIPACLPPLIGREDHVRHTQRSLRSKDPVNICACLRQHRIL